MGRREWSRAERERVRRAMQRTKDARLARRLLAILQVIEGQSVSSVARVMGFSRRALHS
ncbi:MAG: helix-turn-helix domain-containing protein, partial [Hyalangium sp.]|uniref:helix-turn-helix domain-containing protein n=1 Tax=Hyalangium sp. TaxID=2028555 RepID=UPI00389A48A8